MTTTIKKNALTVQLYQSIRKTVSFKEYKNEDVEVALKHTLFSVVAYKEDRPVGIARLVGDDRVTFFIKDVVIIPEYQSNGVGHQLMLALFEYIEEHACEGAYVGLMSTPGKEAFYEKYGFIKRPTENLGSGMVLYYEKKK